MTLEQRLRAATPKITITAGSVNGVGLLRFRALDPSDLMPEDLQDKWYHTTLFIKNLEDSPTACDLTAHMSFLKGEESTLQVGNAWFVDRQMVSFNRKVCLRAGEMVELIVAVWKNGDAKTMRDHSDYQPNGDRLDVGMWECHVTVDGPISSQSAVFRYRVTGDAVLLLADPMPPPGPIVRTA
jgi:hypothetical protein